MWANKIDLFAQIFYPFEVTLPEFAQINDALFAYVYKALCPVHMEQIIQFYLLKF